MMEVVDTIFCIDKPDDYEISAHELGFVEIREKFVT